jgi:hypothetical protein
MGSMILMQQMTQIAPDSLSIRLQVPVDSTRPLAPGAVPTQGLGADAGMVRGCWRWGSYWAGVGSTGAVVLATSGIRNSTCIILLQEGHSVPLIKDLRVA